MKGLLGFTLGVWAMYEYAVPNHLGLQRKSYVVLRDELVLASIREMRKETGGKVGTTLWNGTKSYVNSLFK